MNIKQLRPDSTGARILGALARTVLRHPKWFVYPQILLFGFSIYYTATRLQFDNKRSSLVGANKAYHQNYQNFRKEFPHQDDLVVVVESEDPEKNRQFVERLAARVETETNIFTDLFYKGDLRMLGSKALLFVDTEDLQQLRQRLSDYRPFINQFTRATNLVSLFDLVNQQFRTAKREENSENKALRKALPALQRIIVQATRSLTSTGKSPSPGINALFDPTGKADEKIYITVNHGRIFLLTAQALRPDLNGAAVKRLRELVERTRLEVPGLNIGITGEPVLEIDEMKQSQKDSTLASIVSLLGCALIFIYGYRETGRPIKATICLVVGIAYTLAFTTLTIGHLNILTITFVPIIIGLAIDFGVHLISRYEEELHHGKTEVQALTKAMVYTGQGIFTGAFTTAGAFLAMSFTDFKGIQEMGVICGGGLLICLIPMMTLLPVLLLRGRQNLIDHVQGDLLDRRARIENIWLQRPVTTFVVTLAFCGLAATQLAKVHFDYNLLNMQSAGLPAVEYEEKLIRSSEKSVLFGAVIATNVEQAVALEQQLTNLPAVASVNSAASFLGGNQQEKLPMVRQIKQDLAGLEIPAPDRKPVAIHELSATLYSFYGYLGAAHQEVQKEDPELDRQLTSMQESVNDLRKEMLRSDPNRVPPEVRLGQFQRALFNDIRDTFRALKAQDDSGPMRIEDLPPALRDRFIGVTGKYLVMVTPRKDLWQRENQKEFIDQVATVYPMVTGTPVQLYHYTELLKSSYEEAAKYSLIAICILVLIHFRSLFSLVLTLIPVAVGSVWLAGLMGWLGIPSNPANIMMLPLVIGIGVTNGIHILNRFAEEQRPNILARSTGKAVLVSGLTSIAGFGSLMLAKHRGIESLGYVMSIGLATCMVAGLTFLPAVLNLISRKSRGPKAPSEEPGNGVEETAELPNHAGLTR